MPVRDAELVLYPMNKKFDETSVIDGKVRNVEMNRGASGIDGIISTAIGYTKAMNTPTTLLIGWRLSEA